MLLAPRGYALASVCLITVACGSQQQPSSPSSTPAPPTSTTTGAAGVKLITLPSPVSGTFTPEPDDQDGTPSTGVDMPTPGRASGPAGFDAKIVSHPRPEGDGVIRGFGSLPVTFDACRSTPNPGARLFYMFDLDFNHVADVIGSGRDCSASRSYRIPPSLTGGQVRRFNANVCVANGDPRARDPGTFFACRAFKISVEQLKCGLPSLQGSLLSLSAPATLTIDFDLSPFFTWNGRVVHEGLPPNWNLTQFFVLQIRPTTPGSYRPLIETKTPCGTASYAFDAIAF